MPHFPSNVLQAYEYEQSANQQAQFGDDYTEAKPVGCIGAACKKISAKFKKFRNTRKKKSPLLGEDSSINTLGGKRKRTRKRKRKKKGGKRRTTRNKRRKKKRTRKKKRVKRRSRRR
jgi:hypothetical protein|uniref:Uncharacterized protein n=1 Tax=viral metagenome TaxID=1070528 RepID=A0A6C0IQG8_9ZZZZ